jgi:hypothetical protein
MSLVGPTPVRAWACQVPFFSAATNGCDRVGRKVPESQALHWPGAGQDTRLIWAPGKDGPGVAPGAVLLGDDERPGPIAGPVGDAVACRGARQRAEPRVLSPGIRRQPRSIPVWLAARRRTACTIDSRSVRAFLRAQIVPSRVLGLTSSRRLPQRPAIGNAGSPLRDPQ